jgi:uncharacterized membrane-anchored protein
MYSIRNHHILRKVPEITIFFWVIKLLTTAMGEATSDFAVFKFNRYLAVFSGGVVFLIALIIQLKSKKYNPWIYWFTVTMVAVFGTMAADSLHLQLHVPYIASTILFAIALAVVFVVWHRTEGTFSIHSINTTRREIFYWLTVLATFALGTAAGDLTATTVGIGYFGSGLLFSGLFLIPGIIYLFTKRHQVLWFWSSYVLTRPLGASFADWTSKSKRVGALNYGDGHVAIILTIVIIIFVAFLAVSKVDIKPDSGRIIK